MIRRIITLGIAALAFWGGMNFERMQLRVACTDAGGRVIGDLLCEGARP